jgi:hypothetical protein
MKKSKDFTTKYSEDVMAKVDREFPYVVKYNFVKGKAGYVSTLNTFHPHFNHVQFTKLILDNFHKKVKELEKLVKIYYYNIDAFIIDESGYQTLVEHGMIGENMGQLKVIEVFEEVVFESSRKFMAICKDGSVYCRPKKLINKTNFNDFKNSVLKAC